MVTELSWTVVAYAVLSLTVVRMLPVALALLGTGTRPPTVAFIGWFGPRGLASIVFGLGLIGVGLPNEALVLTVIFMTVLLSVFAHGLSAPGLTTAVRAVVRSVPAQARCRGSRSPRESRAAGLEAVATAAPNCRRPRRMADTLLLWSESGARRNRAPQNRGESHSWPSSRTRSAPPVRSSPLGGLVPEWVINIGILSWTMVGVVAVLMIFATFFAMSASITVPLILAMVIGMISYPLVEKMVAKRVPVAGAAVIVLVFLAVVIAFAGWVVITGVVSQWPAIQAQLQAGLDSAAAYLNSLGFNGDSLKTALSSPDTASSASAATGGLASSLGSAVASGLSGIFAMFFGIFISAMLLFYVLTDFDNIARWIGSHMGLPLDVGLGIVDDAVCALRGYFRATTITGLVVSVTIGLAMLLLGIPLAGAVVIVTFLTCYIPFFGAIISGAFAFLIALGTSGLTQAIIILVIVLVAQNVLQTIINARVMGDSLNLSPLVVLVVTMLGSIFAGLLGAALAAPVTALLISAGKRLSAVNFDDYAADDEDDEPSVVPSQV